MAETDNHCPDENSTNGNNNGFDSKGDLESGVDTASHYSLEDAATRVELALRKTLKLDECNNAVYCSVYEEPDVTKLPGYQPIPPDCPLWRKDMIERKNKQLEEEAKEQLAALRAEEEKWKNVPEWKRVLIEDKEKRKQEELGPTEANRKRQEEEMRRLQAMPDWKRNLLLKKKTDGV